MAFKVPEQFRINHEIGRKMVLGLNAPVRVVNLWLEENEKVGDKETGNFILPNPKTKKGMYILCRSSAEGNWEHVMITIPSENRCPTAKEMSYVKKMFWDNPNDVVVQFQENYSEKEEFCLHLWKRKGQNIETPPSILVGIIKGI